MFDLKTPAIAAAIVLAATLNHAGADMIELSGQGASSNVPLNAQLDVHIVDPYSVILTLTNNAYDGGADNRITYFGFQMPTAGVSINIDSESDGSWSAKQYAKLPGAGANTFNWLYQTKDKGGAAGLNLGQSLVLNVLATQPVFDPLVTADWSPTSKHGYLFAAKFQSVGIDAEDSGVAIQSTPTTVPPSSPPPQASIPEPATFAIGLVGACFFLAGRPSRRR